jgi:hypothetical protein
MSFLCKIFFPAQYESAEDCRKRTVLTVRVCPEEKLQEIIVSQVPENYISSFMNVFDEFLSI